MLLLDIQLNVTPRGIFDILAVVVALIVFLCCRSIFKDEYDHQEDQTPTHRRTSATSAPSRHKKQSLKEMKRIVVKKNGQYTYYRINKYGEIFEEPHGE